MGRGSEGGGAADRCHSMPGGRKRGVNIGCRKQSFQHMVLVEMGEYVCVMESSLYE